MMAYMPTTRRFLRWFGLYPSEHIKETGILDTLYIFVVSLPLWFVLLTCYAYFNANFETADIAVITDAMYTNFIFQMMCGNYFMLALRKFQIREVIDEMEAMVKERLQKGDETMYSEANVTSESFIKKYTLWCFIGNMGVNCFPFVRPAFHYVIGKYSFESWYTPYKSYLPNNVTYTPIGMTTTLIGQEIGCVCAILLSSTYLSLYVSSCVYISAFMKNVAKRFEKLDQKFDTNSDMEVHYIDIIQLHTKAIVVRGKVSKMISAYLFFSVCNCVGALCTLMFQLQVSASNLSIEIYQAFGIGSLMVLFLYLFCYFGEMVADRSFRIAGAAWMTRWYLYPIKIRRYMRMTYVYANVDYHFSGLGLMYCTMASFSGLVKTSVSFFMLFRNVA